MRQIRVLYVFIGLLPIQVSLIDGKIVS